MTWNHRAAAAAALAVLLSLATPSCAGSTHLRGGSGGIPGTPERWMGYYGGKRARGGGERELQASAAGGGNNNGTRSNSTAVVPPVPECATLFVPVLVGPLTGLYTFKGRFNDDRPVFTDPLTGNHIFHDASNFYITQPSASLFLSLESDAFELSALADGLYPWVRNNDPTCTQQQQCTWSIRITCTAVTADAAAPTPEPAIAAASAANSTYASTAAPTVAPTDAMTLTPTIADPSPPPSRGALGGCEKLSIANGAGRTGVYAVNTRQAPLVRNNRPIYMAEGANRTDRIFSIMMNACATGYGLVDTVWAESTGQLPPTATTRAVFLMYVAENGGGLGGVGSNNTAAAAAASCEVPVWFITSGDIHNLDAADANTFLSLSDVQDPSAATSWAKFTPATATARATLLENDWIDVGCAEAAGQLDGTGAPGSDESAAGTGAASSAGVGGGDEIEAIPVGIEPNGRHSRQLWAEKLIYLI